MISLRSPILRVALVALLVTAPGGCDPAADSSPVALVGGTLIDGTGLAPVENAVVILQGKEILAVGSADQVSPPPGAVLLDVSGKTVLPGLIESNSHIIFTGTRHHSRHFVEHLDKYYEIGARNLFTSLMQGITTTRDTMDPLDVMVRLKRDVKAGLVPGSRLVTSGTILNYPRVAEMLSEENPALAEFPQDRIRLAAEGMARPIRDAAHGREVVRWKAARGADFIKVSADSGDDDNTQVLSTAELAEIVEEAHAHGLPVTTHTGSVEAVKSVVRAGVDAMEHPQITLPMEAGPDESVTEAELPAGLVQEIAERGIYSIPLQVAIEVYTHVLKDPEILTDPSYVRHAPASVVQDAREWAQEQLAEHSEVILRRKERAHVSRKNLQKLISAGAPIAMGTDKGTFLNFHESGNHVRELEIYVELGMTPMEAIVSATKRGAELVGLAEHIGTVEPGKLADVIVVAGDPLADLSALHQVVMVFKEGVRYR